MKQDAKVSVFQKLKKSIYLHWGKPVFIITNP